MIRLAGVRFAQLRPALATVLLLAFGSNSALPGLLHGCGTAATGDVAAESMHHGDHDRTHHTSGPSAPCSCVDHSCCVAALAPIGTAAVTLPPLTVVTDAPLPFDTAFVPVTPSFLQPYPLGPPALI